MITYDSFEKTYISVLLGIFVSQNLFRKRGHAKDAIYKKFKMALLTPALIYAIHKNKADVIKAAKVWFFSEHIISLEGKRGH